MISGNSSSTFRWTREARKANASMSRSTCGSSQVSGSSRRRPGDLRVLLGELGPHLPEEGELAFVVAEELVAHHSPFTRNSPLPIWSRVSNETGSGAGSTFSRASIRNFRERPGPGSGSTVTTTPSRRGSNVSRTRSTDAAQLRLVGGVPAREGRHVGEAVDGDGGLDLLQLRRDDRRRARVEEPLEVAPDGLLQDPEVLHPRGGRLARVLRLVVDQPVEDRRADTDLVVEPRHLGRTPGADRRRTRKGRAAEAAARPRAGYLRAEAGRSATRRSETCSSSSWKWGLRNATAR